MVRLGSVCSGIGGAELGKPPGWSTAFVSEVDRFPRDVLAHHYPDVPMYGDFTKIENENVDVLIGGVPCQSFSVAGKRGLDDDERGQLIYKFVELAHRCGARWFVIENVPGLIASDAFARFCAYTTARPEFGNIGCFGNAGILAGNPGGFSIAWRVFDARYFGVAQRRRRVWIVGHIGENWRPLESILFETAGSRRNVASRGREWSSDTTGAGTATETNGGGPQIVTQKDIDGRITASDVCRTLRGQHAGMRPLVYSQSLGRYQELEHAPTLTATVAKGAGHTPITICENHGIDGRLKETDIAPTIAARAGAGGGNLPLTVMHDDEVVNWHKGNGTARPSKFAPTITTFVGREFETNQGVPITDGRLRYLTPLECERLQGFPDGWTDIPGATKSKRYKALGNAFVPAVCRWVLDGIAEQENHD